MSSPNQYIQFKEHKKSDGTVLLEIELNNSEKLNVLNLEIIFALNKTLRAWRSKKELSAVFIHAAGEKAFCAGGDVAQVYSSILESKKQGKDPALAVRAFFHTEYETDYMLSQLSAPVVLWGERSCYGRRSRSFCGFISFHSNRNKFHGYAGGEHWLFS